MDIELFAEFLRQRGCILWGRHFDLITGDGADRGAEWFVAELRAYDQWLAKTKADKPGFGGAKFEDVPLPFPPS